VNIKNWSKLLQHNGINLSTHWLTIHAQAAGDSFVNGQYKNNGAAR
jgi:hypothetical protein